jgi:phosphoribulokinase
MDDAATSTADMQRTREHPVMIGIVGDSGSGKSTIAKGLAEVLGADRTLIICIDDYIKHDRKRRADLGVTAHDPAGNHIDILEQHVALLRDGQPVLKPVYNHHGGVLEPAEYVVPRDFIIFEGMLGYSTPWLRDAYDVKFFLDPQEQLRLRWKFQRDTTQGGYTVEQVMASLDRLNRDSAIYVQPQRIYADMVVSFYPPEDAPEESGGRLNVRHILRPTLPYLDLAPMLEQGGEAGFELELARDIDGRPVDALHVFGTIGADGAYDKVRDTLWSQIAAAAGTPPPALGEYRAASPDVQTSPPLALSQLLVGHYLLNAAEAAAIS